MSFIVLANIVLIYLISVRAVAYQLLVWFDGAKFFVEYGKLIGLRRIVKPLDKYLLAQERGANYSYLEFLQIISADSFFTSLITCEKCLSFWLSLITFGFLLLAFGSISTLTILSLPILAMAVSYEAISRYKNIR